MVNANPALFTVVDISDSTAPFVTDTLYLEQFTGSQAVYVLGGFAYVGTGGPNGKIFKIDVSDPYDISFAWPFIGYPACNCNIEDISISGDYLFAITDVAGLRVYDNSDPDTLIYLCDVSTPSYGKGLFISGDYAYVACAGAGLAIYDISGPCPIPSYCAVVDTICSGADWACYPYVVGNIAVFTREECGIQIVDVANPCAPVVLGSYTDVEYSHDVFITKSRIYATDQYSGIKVLGMSDPENPCFLDQVDTPGAAQGIFVSDGLIFVADGTEGLQIIDLRWGVGDCNRDGVVDIADVVCLINYLFVDGPPPCD